MPFLDPATQLPPDASWKEMYRASTNHVWEEYLGSVFFAILTISIFLASLFYSKTKADDVTCLVWGVIALIAMIAAFVRVRKSLRDRATRPSVYQGTIRNIFQTPRTVKSPNTSTYVTVDDQILHYPYRIQQRKVPEETGAVGQEVIVRFLPNQKIILALYAKG